MAIINDWIESPDPYNTARYRGKYKNTRRGNRVTPLPYDTYGGRMDVPQRVWTPYGYRWYGNVDIPNLSLIYDLSQQGGNLPVLASARNKAWSDFVEDVRTGPASLGIAFAEWPQSLNMISNRLLGLRAGYRDLRRGRFRSFLKRFSIGAKRKHRNKVSNAVNEASSLWLEYSFGWKPLTQDVYDGINSIGQPVPAGPCKGSGRQTFRKTYGTSTKQRYTGNFYCKIGADVYISNPNLYLAQQLGLANPALVAWELVPFSFMVDWVFDVGTCLGAMTDLLGCSVSNRYFTGYAKSRIMWDEAKAGGGRYYSYGDIYWMKRQTSFPYILPNTSYLANIGTSMNRAANAASLLGQILTK